MPFYKHCTRRSGFTLAEVLIALALLGVLAAFLIPKIMQSSGSQRRNAVMKETIGSLYTVLREGTLKSEITPSNFYTYFAGKMNILKGCPNASDTDGCYDISKDGNTPVNFQFNEPGLVLPSGAVISGFSPCCDSTTSIGHTASDPGEFQNSITIDWNGDTAPNKIGEDQMLLSVCFGSKGCQYNSNVLPVCTDPTHPTQNRQPAGTLAPTSAANLCTPGYTPTLQKSADLYFEVLK